ncbi:alpha/beta hydrolase-fold protein [Arthrobacter sp. ok362]|uniref:alpha/beta hydrolase-fold protein n=1 Tax=Arthrobacter sp. ok362 TaxID=1761745 RepID=UPI0008876EFF|nr:alpha/beta hydrolase-fold protein [Arthrobacter sp. ok362]SDL67533.1 Putative esterase [Arthrobacter sp. ok362]
MEQLLDLSVIASPLLYSFYVLSVLAALFLVLRAGLRPRPAGRVEASALEGSGSPSRISQLPGWRIWLATAAVATACGALTGAVVLFVSEVLLNVFGLPLDADTRIWVICAFAGLGLAAVNLWRSRWWRKAVAVLACLLFIATAALGINAGYGLNPTLGAMLGLSQIKHLALPKLFHPHQPKTGSALWRGWKPPAGMPSAGRSGAVTIPADASGFHARDAFLYLPPAALVDHPPALPIIVMMMGQPGGPEQSKSAVHELDALARQNHGLAPLLLTVDQLGNPYRNPVCVDSVKGNVYTYVTTDVVNFIRKNLNVAPDRSQWAVAGYSNGGECALSFAAKRPEIFGSLLDISGELEPVNGSAENTVKTIFGGNESAFTAEKPATILKAHTYSDELAIFTSGSRDSRYGPQSAEAAADAKAAGMTTHRFVGAGIGHRGDALGYGLKSGLPLLFQRFFLARP